MSIGLIIIFVLLSLVIIAFFPYILAFVVDIADGIIETIVKGWRGLIDYIKNGRAEE